MLRNTKAKNLEIYFDSLHKLAKQLLPEEKAEKTHFSKWVNKNHDQEKVGKYMFDILRSFQIKQSYPALSFQEENELLKCLANLSRRLINVTLRKLQDNKEVDKEFMATFSMTHACIKSFMQEFFPLKGVKEMNFNYLDKYAAYREFGVAVPSRYALLKQEVLDVFHCYFQPYSVAKFNVLLGTAIDTLENDESGINAHSGNYSQSFLNIVKWLNLFRLMLIDQNEPILLPPITRALDRALGIVRPDIHRTLEVQRSMLTKYDLIRVEMNLLEKMKPTIDSNYGSVMVKLGVFSRAEVKPSKGKTSENHPVLGITRLI